jgi:threonine aldolase
LIARLRDHGILLAVLGGRLRACPHLDIDDAMIDETVEVIRSAVRRG